MDPNDIIPGSDALYWTCRAMLYYGGSFVKALSECMKIADSRNLRILVEAFPEYIKTYSERGEHMRQKMMD